MYVPISGSDYRNGGVDENYPEYETTAGAEYYYAAGQGGATGSGAGEGSGGAPTETGEHNQIQLQTMYIYTCLSV